MVPAAHRLKIWVQIWAQFSLPGAPSALFTLLGITEDSSEVLCFPLAVSSHGGSHRFESYSAHRLNQLLTEVGAGLRCSRLLQLLH
jgi:hypothetical protein